MSDFFNVSIEGASITDCTGLVCSLIYISDCDGRGVFFTRESIFSDKLLVNARDVCAGVY